MQQSAIRIQRETLAWASRQARLAVLLLGACAGPVAGQTLLPGPTRIETRGFGIVSERLPDGGVLVAGQYTGILGGPARPGLTRFAADGSVVAGFDPDFEFSGFSAITSVVVAGGVAYLGGNFLRVNGQPRAGLAAIDLATNALTSWNPSSNLAVSNQVLAASAGAIYIAGSFTMIGGAARSGLAAVDPTTGLATAWNPGQAFGVTDALVAPDGLFIAGTFLSLGTPSVARSRLAKLDLATGGVLAFNAAIAGTEVRTLRLVGSTLFAGGEFSFAAMTPRNNVAAFDASTGALLAFNPNVTSSPSAQVNDLEVDGDAVYLCGNFNRVGGLVRTSAAEVAASDGAVRAWNGNLAGGRCQDLLLDGSGIIATGSFDRAGTQERLGLVRLARTDATPDNTFPGLLRPLPSGVVLAVAPDGSRFVTDPSAEMRAVEGVARTGLARYAPDGTHDTGFALAPRGLIRALATDGTTLFIGGQALSPDGMPLIAFDIASGLPVAMPAIERNQAFTTPIVTAIGRNGGDLLIGGRFDRVEGVSATGLAVVRISDRHVRATPALFNSGGASVDQFSVAGGRVAFRGVFVSVDGALRRGVAALDGTSYALLPWAPEVAGAVDSILATPARIYLGGRFSQLGTPGGPVFTRNGLAAVDSVTAAVLPWDPNVLGNGSASCGTSGCSVIALALDGDTLYAGGLFATVGGQARGNFAAVDVITGAVRPLDAALDPNSVVSSIGLADRTLTIAGSFYRARSARRTGIAAFDLADAPPPDPLFANGFETTVAQ